MYNLVSTASLPSGANTVTLTIPEGTDWQEAYIIGYASSANITSVTYRYLDEDGNVLKAATAVTVTGSSAFERALEPFPVVEFTITMSGEGGTVNLAALLKR